MCCLVVVVVGQPLAPPLEAQLQKGVIPFRHHPNFMGTAESRAMVSDYIQKWFAEQPNYPIARLSRIIPDKNISQLFWDELIGDDEARKKLLYLPTRPGWVPVGFSEDVSPCIYKFKGTDFGVHLDDDGRDRIKKEVILAKLMLYPSEFQGGELVFYSRNVSKKRWNKKDSNQTHVINVKAGSAVLFDLWYPHSVLPIKSDTKQGVGLRVIYELKNV